MRSEGSYLILAALTQVVGEVVVDVGGENAAVLGVELQHLPQAAHADVLQVAVRQRLHIGVGFNHLLRPRQVRPDQVTFA